MAVHGAMGEHLSTTCGTRNAAFANAHCCSVCTIKRVILSAVDCAALRWRNK